MSIKVDFGTSGLRGRVEDLSCAVCTAYTCAFLKMVANCAPRVAIGIDRRPSSPMIAKHCSNAAHASGFEVIWCGVLSTPALAVYAQMNNIPAIMITGSHIPFDRNGIKFYRRDGEITKKDEVAITSALECCRMAEPGNYDLPVDNGAARDNYVRRYVDFFQPGALTNLKLGLYEHSSASRDELRTILESLGAQVIGLGRTDAFVPVDTEAVSPADKAQAKHWVHVHGLDALISTDGDGDRPLVADETGIWWRGDILGLVCAQALGAEAVVVPVSCNTALEACGFFRRAYRTRIGSPYVIEGIEILQREGIQAVVGFEANGGFLLGYALERDGRRLEALLTRDAALPAVAVLALARKRGVALSALLDDLPKRHTASNLIKETPTAWSQKLLAQLRADNCRIESLLGLIVGSCVKKIDTTDGLRMLFRNGEIVHLRPSGNAPELRCYAEAGDPSRAAALVNGTLHAVENLLNDVDLDAVTDIMR